MTSTPTIAGTATRPPVRRTHVDVHQLIRTLDGAEVPVAGQWVVGAGQSVRLTARGVRRRSIDGRVLGGVLDVTDDLVGSTLALSVSLDDDTAGSDPGLPTRDPPEPIELVLAVTAFGASGRWWAVGASSSASGSEPVTVEIDYHGVFRHAGHTALWLSLDGGLDHRQTRRPQRLARRPHVKIETELTLLPAA